VENAQDIATVRKLYRTADAWFWSVNVDYNI